MVEERAPAASLEVEHLTKVFGKTRVVDDVSFGLPGGKFLTLLGPSGSGKTTTMRMIAGFDEPTDGDVRIAGESVVNLHAHRRNIGVVFQQYALFPHLTVFKNVAYALEMRKCSKAEIRRRVEAALAMVRMSEFEQRYPRQLSGGQQQRVALARAIVFEPRLLLMDEPMSALDKRLRELMQVELRQLQRQLGITTVCVTHDQVEALVMSDVVAVLDGGVLQQIGPPLEVYQRPVNRFVADFLGESNLLHGSITRGDHGLAFVSDKGLSSSLDCGSPNLPGDAGWVVIRPENLKVGLAAANLPNQCVVEIQDILYVGDFLKYRVVCPSGDELIVKCLAEHEAPLALGVSALLGWRSENCIPVAP
jgi:spermidine/putrescine ABC transporter ATP-binding subunit